MRTDVYQTIETYHVIIFFLRRLIGNYSELARILCNDETTSTFISAIRNAMNEQLQMIVCIVPNNKKDRYDAIKKLCCVDLGIPSQVVVSRTLAKKQMLMSVATKIAIQMNCKLGGQVWRVSIPVMASCGFLLAIVVNYFFFS